MFKIVLLDDVTSALIESLSQLTEFRAFLIVVELTFLESHTNRWYGGSKY